MIEVHKRGNSTYDFVDGIVLCRVAWHREGNSTGVTMEDPEGCWTISEITPHCVTTATYNGRDRVVHLAVIRDRSAVLFHLLVGGERLTVRSLQGDLTSAAGEVVHKVSDVWKDSELKEGMKWRVVTPFLPEPPVASLYLGLWFLPMWFPLEVP